LRNQRWGETLVALAGSATNLSLAVIFGLIVRTGALPPDALALAASITFINLFLGLFNLLPFPPLDGFTALRSALPWRFATGLVRIEQRMRDMGVASLIVFLLVFSYIFAGPFYKTVLSLFGLLTGAGIQ
jgi:Zn-dependent protease